MDYSKISDPYSVWDNSLNPKHLIWELYKRPASEISDERHFEWKAFEYLKEKAELIEEFTVVEDTSDEEDDSFIMGGTSNKSLFLYRKNLIQAYPQDDKTVKLSFFYPLGTKPLNKMFEKWVRKTTGQSKVSILVTRGGGLAAQKVSFDPPVIDNLDLNYGTGFSIVHQMIVDKMNKRGSGIMMFHGVPGSGKSFYVKMLSSIINREFIFIPVNLADRIGSPEFTALLLNKKEAVIVLEDAEQVIQSRENGPDFGISTLLNLSDGLLGQCLNIMVLATYNCDDKVIDRALLRPGRLKMKHNFSALSMEDAKRLAKHLNKDVEVKGPMTLAEVYSAGEKTNISDEPNVVKVPEVGFHTLLAPPSTPKK